MLQGTHWAVPLCVWSVVCAPVHDLLQIPGWIERPPATEEEAPQGGEGDRHGNRKRPSPKDSSPPTPPAKLARMDSLEVATAAAQPAAPRGGHTLPSVPCSPPPPPQLPGSNPSLGQHSPEGGGSSVQTMVSTAGDPSSNMLEYVLLSFQLPHWTVEERERERQQRGVSAWQLSDGPRTCACMCVSTVEHLSLFCPDTPVLGVCVHSQVTVYCPVHHAVTSSGSDATGNGSDATGGSSLAARPSALSELPVPVQHCE